MLWIVCEDGSLCNLGEQAAIVMRGVTKDGVPNSGQMAVVAMQPGGNMILASGSDNRCDEVMTTLKEMLEAQELPPPSPLSIAREMPRG